MVPYVTVGKNITPFGNVDAAWLGMEDPTNLMMVGAVFTFDGSIGFENFKKILEHRLLPIKRFRQRPVQAVVPPHNKFWETDTNFDISAHVIEAELSDPDDETTLKELFNTLMSTPLDYTQPLWQAHYVDGYKGGAAVLWRIHHCMADGLALINLLLSLTDPDEKMPTLSKTPPEYPPELWNPFGPFIDITQDVIKNQIVMTGLMMEESMKIMQQPMRIFDLTQKGIELMMSTNRVFTRSADPQTVFKGKLGVPKRISWSSAVPLSDIKAIQQVIGEGLNDILLTAMTGALRRYMEIQGDVTAEVSFRAAVPINLRGKHEIDELGNKFGLVFVALPVGIVDPVERLKALKKRIDALKDSSEAIVVLGLLNSLGLSPSEVQDAVVDFIGQKVTTVMTNLAGPCQKIYLGGTAVDSILFWTPQVGRVGLGINIYSYNDQVRLGVMVDAGLIPDPDKITDYFLVEFEEMLKLTQQVETIESPSEPEPMTVETAPILSEPEPIVETIVEPEPTTIEENPAVTEPTPITEMATEPEPITIEADSIVSESSSEPKATVNLEPTPNNAVEPDPMIVDDSSIITEPSSEPETVANVDPETKPESVADPEPTAPIMETVVEPRPTKCQAITKAGNPCRNKPLAGSQFCRVHQPK